MFSYNTMHAREICTLLFLVPLNKKSMSLEESPDLKRGVFAALDTAGVLTKVKAFMYAQVWAVLHNRELNEVDPLLQATNFISDEDLKVLAYLVKWLTDKGMVNTLKVLELESGRSFNDLPEVDSYEFMSSPGTRSPGHSDIGAAFSDMSMEPISEYTSPARNTSSPRRYDDREKIIPTQPSKGSAFSLRQDNLFGDDQSQETNLTTSNASMAPGVSLGPEETSSSRQSPSRMTDFSFKYTDRSMARNSMLSPDTAAHARRAAEAQAKFNRDLNLSPKGAHERTDSAAHSEHLVTELVVPEPQYDNDNNAYPQDAILADSHDLSTADGVSGTSSINDLKPVTKLQLDAFLSKTDSDYVESLSSVVTGSTGGPTRQATLNLLDAVGRDMQTYDSTIAPGDSTIHSGFDPMTQKPETQIDTTLIGDSNFSAMGDSAAVDSALAAGKVAARMIGMPEGTTSILTNMASELNDIKDISSIHAGADDAISTKPQPSLNSEFMAGGDFVSGIVLERTKPTQQPQPSQGDYTLDNYGDLSLGVTISNETQPIAGFNYENIQEDEFGDFEF